MDSAPGISRGTVLWASDPFKPDSGAERPLVVLSDDTHPFHGEQWIAVAVSTTARRRALELTEDDWTAGSLPQRSYAYPWAVLSPRLEQADYVLGNTADEFVNELTDEVQGYISAPRN